MADAFIYDAIRTPRGKGKQGGSLYEVKPIDLVTNLLEEMNRWRKVEAAQNHRVHQRMSALYSEAVLMMPTFVNGIPGMGWHGIYTIHTG